MNKACTKTHPKPSVTVGSRTTLPITTENSVFLFPDGLPAFEEAKQFVFTCKPETSPLLFMCATEPANLGFACIDPFLICPEYKPRISDADAAFLEINDTDEILILSIVTASPDVRKTTANLQGPLAINLRTRKGKQIICDRQDYPVRYAIWDALERMAEGPTAEITAADTNRSAA
jgi:flagellar assembly factor FliW